MYTATKGLKQLQNLLIAPSVKAIRKSPVHDQDRGYHYVEVLVPGYHPDTSENPMQMDVTFQRDSLASPINGAAPSTPTRYHYPEEHIEDLRAVEIEPVPANENHPFRLKVYYKRKTLTNRMDKYRWQFRFKQIISANLSQPLADPSDKSNPDNGWLIYHGATTK